MGSNSCHFARRWCPRFVVMPPCPTIHCRSAYNGDSPEVKRRNDGGGHPRWSHPFGRFESLGWWHLLCDDDLFVCGLCDNGGNASMGYKIPPWPSPHATMCSSITSNPKPRDQKMIGIAICLWFVIQFRWLHFTTLLLSLVFPHPRQENKLVEGWEWTCCDSP